MSIKQIGVGLLSLILSACGEPTPQAIQDLPWQLSQTAQGHTRVFQLELGKTTLREMIEQRRHFPELALFVPKTGDSLLEAYFGKQTLGVLEAKLVAELAADSSLREQVSQERLRPKPQPSGAWRFDVAESHQALVNSLRVRYLIYIPVADYPADLVRARFGTPAEMVPMMDKAAYWLYPEQGLILLVNEAGGEIFYYSALADWPALKQRLLTQKLEDMHG